MANIHPLLIQLRSMDLSHPSDGALGDLMESGESDGLTPAEGELLGSVRSEYGAGWTQDQRRAFDDWFRSAPRGPMGAPTNARGPDPEDLNTQMRTVWMQGIGDGVQEAYLADMVRLGADLDFNIVLQLPYGTPIGNVARYLMRQTNLPIDTLDAILDVVPSRYDMSVWGEDNKILTNAADPAHPVRVLVPPDISDMSVYKAMVFTQSEGYHPYHEGFQGAVDERREVLPAAELANQLGRDIVRTRTYIEGGNLLPGVTPDGRGYALVGRDTIVVSAFHLDEVGGFSRQRLEQKIQSMQDSGAFTRPALEETATKLLAVEQATSWRARRYVDNALLNEAEVFMAKLELTHEMLTEDLSLGANSVCVITQPEFHIDMHIRPMAAGEVFVNHPARCIELLREALQDPAAPRWEKAELTRMLRYAEYENAQMGHVYDQILAELGAAGILAIPAPGVFQNEERLANFMNAVPGTTADGQQYLLTNASSLKSLERAFARFATRYGVDRVEFLGGQGGGRNSLSASEISLEMYGGFDCRQVDHAGRRQPRRDLANALYTG